ncbi:methyltransferase domain-containing protein [Pseudomonas tohonis]|nr:methyltransferase domain-containing protein [Pseudomonas tohonis]
MKVFWGKKKPEHYKGLLVKADLGLHEQIADKIKNTVPSGARILDLGAGEGALAARLSDMGYKVTAADKDRDSFKFDDIDFSCIDFDLPSDIASFVAKHEAEFDAVLGVEVIEHVQDQWEYVRQLMKMAKAGGLVLITTPNTTSWLSRVIFLLTGRFHQFADEDLSYGHVNPISPWELQLIMRESGASQVELVSAGTLPPFYFIGSIKLLFINLFALMLRPVSRGFLDGWCIMATGRKPQ